MTEALRFADLPLDPALLPGLEALGLVQLTPVQARALPPILEGRDVIAQAPTGSGKTAAFGVGLLQRIDPGATRVQALVLCPTRELADQVARHLRRLATGIPNLKLLTLTGGVPLAPQQASLAAHPPHVVVGTPGRIQELIAGRALSLREARLVVLDEADRMLDMGFEEQVRDVLAAAPASRQTLLFSATYPEAIRVLARAGMRDPVEVVVEGVSEPAIEERFLEVDPARRPEALAGLLLEAPGESAVVFCTMRRDTEEVAGSLAHLGFPALALHGDLEQRDRDEVVVRFANRSCTVLVATDVAARGLDIDDVALVVNYEPPTDADAYVHRIGRTARAGRSGRAMTLCAPREMGRIAAIETALGRRIRLERPPLAALKPGTAPRAEMVTLRIDAGRTDKLRPGDIVGALTGDAGVPGTAVGRIDVFPTRSYVAVARAQADRALAALQAGRIKGRRFRVRRL